MPAFSLPKFRDFVRRTRRLSLIVAAVAAGLPLSTRVGGAEDASAVRIMALGDSITASTCYLGFLAGRLEQASQQKIEWIGTRGGNFNCGGVRRQIRHEGHNCYRATWLLLPAGKGDRHGCDDGDDYVGDERDAARWLDAAVPDIVILHFGTNDTWASLPPDEILKSYSLIVERLRKKNPRVRFLVAQIVPNAHVRAPVDALNRAIPGWAAHHSVTGSPISVVDLNTGFDLSMMRDGVHPSDAGADWMAKRLAESLAPMVGKGRS